MSSLLSQLSPSITNMIRLDHTHVLSAFHQPTLHDPNTLSSQPRMGWAWAITEPNPDVKARSCLLVGRKVNQVPAQVRPVGWEQTRRLSPA